MTEQELQAIEREVLATAEIPATDGAALIAEVRRLWAEQRGQNVRIVSYQAENGRLQWLIKKAEWAASIGDCRDPACPWCSAWEGDEHLATCPAFGSAR